MTRTDLVGGVSALRGGGALKDFDGLLGPQPRRRRPAVAEIRKKVLLVARAAKPRTILEELRTGRYGKRGARRHHRKHDRKPLPNARSTRSRHQSPPWRIFRMTNVPILSTKAPKNVDLRMVPSLTRRRTPPTFHTTADVEGLAAVGNRVERSLHRRAVGYSYDAVKIFCDMNGKVPRVPYREHAA